MQSQQKPDHEATISGEWHVRYNYSVGKVAGHFFEELRRGKIFASFCSASNMAYLPPRAYCEILCSMRRVGRSRAGGGDRGGHDCRRCFREPAASSLRDRLRET